MGYLKNGVVQFNNANFEIDTSNFQNDKVLSSTSNEIKLKQINNASEATIVEIPIIMTPGENVDKDILSKIAEVKFTGTYLDENGKERAIKKELANEVKWEGTAETQLAGEVSKYLPYEIGNEKGVLVQARIRTGLKDNSLPIHKTRLKVEVPEIAGSKPERMKVVAVSTEATNGKTNSAVQYTYNEETNKLEIEVQNNEQDGKISWKKNTVDEYLINYIYTGEDIYNQIRENLEKAKQTIKTEEEIKEGQTNENAITGEIEVTAEIESYNNKETKTEKTGKISYNIEEAKGEIIDIAMTAEEKVSKGYIYANYAKSEKEAKKEVIEEKQETNFDVNYTAQINDTALTRFVEFITTPEKYIDQEGQEHDTTSENIYTKIVKISEENFNKMLGEDGKIEITDKEGNKIAQISADLEADQEGNYVVDISEAKVNEIRIKTSRIITEGTIAISVEKAITANQNLTKSEMQNIQNIETQVNAKIYALENVQGQNETEDNQEQNENQEEGNQDASQADENQPEHENQESKADEAKVIEIINNTNKSKINLTEPVSKAEISIDTQNLSTTVENKDVELRAILDTSSTENALYKNPVLQIILPENIEKLDIESVNLLLEDELKIKETKIEEVNGRKIIKITLEGTQTKYATNGEESKELNNVIIKGANIVIKANITFKKLAPRASTKIYLYYTNENTQNFEKYYQKPETKKPDGMLGASGRGETTKEAIGLASTGIEIVSPNGVVTENHIEGFKTNGSISNEKEEKQEAQIDANAEAKQVTIGGTIVNNYENSIENVFILGRIPFSGNKQIDTNEDLGSKFTMPMKEKIAINGIDTNKVKIYYSTNGEATKDFLDTNNGWTETPNNLSEIKSYLIVISGEVAKGTQLNFDYKAEIPANLNYSSSSYTTYKVYYDNKMEDATLGESKLAGIVGLVTGQGSKIQVEVKSNVETAREGQIVRMTATIQNNGDVTAKNAKLLITAPEGTAHTQIIYGRKYYSDSTEAEKIIELGNIKQGETVTKEYDLKIKEPEEKLEGNITISNRVRLSAENITGEIRSKNYDLKVAKGDLSVTNIPNKHETDVLKKGDKIQYRVELENISVDTQLENVTLHGTLPEGIKIEDVYYIRKTSTVEEEEKKTKDGVSVKGNEITVNVGKLESTSAYVNEIVKENPKVSGEELVKLIDAKTERICTEADVYIEFSVENFQGDYDCIMNATAKNVETHYSNVQKLSVEKVELQFSQQALNKKYVKEGTEYSYNFTLKNNGKVASSETKMKMTLPEGISFVKAQYTRNGKTTNYMGNNRKEFEINFRNVEPGETIAITVTVKADLLTDNKDKQITTVATIETDGINTIESNRVQAVIEYNDELHIEEPGENSNSGNSGNSNNTGNTGNSGNNNTVAGSYKITGTAWVDANRNGQRDEGEELLAGVQVALLYKSNSGLVKDQTTGKDKIVTTNKNGTYEFNNLSKDEYLVLFVYDAGKYSITDYQKAGVAESVNSDATSMKIVLNGEQRQTGISNTIKITNSNARDIDIGLFVAEKFDLRLDKYISKITLTTPSSGTKVYNYNNVKITKREVPDKDVNKSSVVVEYKIVVTNEGQVEGYAKKIIDYLPDNVRFNSELNKDWFISDNNGAVYNTALANQKLLPGQSKEVKLVLSFNITDKNIGTLVSNNAEIYESYNELGLEDMDSTVANRLETEDDMSNADIMLSVQTGTIILYTTLILGIVLLLGIGIFEIRRRVFIKRKV